jgi:hypothetical protein
MRRAWFAVVALVPLLAAACGDDSSTSATTKATTTSASPTGASSTGAASTTAAATTSATTKAPTASSTASSVASSAPTRTPGSYSTPLKGVCPDNVVVQTNWWPENDHGLFYQLIGKNGKFNADKYVYSGPLGTTGVNLEIRAGGPATGRQLVTAQLYQDDSILLGLLGTDEQVSTSAQQPTVSVLAWYQKTPQIFMWGNPEWDFKSVADIGKSGATVLAFNGAPYLDVFTGQGLLKASQIDQSYNGTPARFVASDGKVVQQGFATSEPYLYERDVQGWQKPVKFLLVANEYPVYLNSVAIRADKLASATPCLEKLVPLLQQAAVDYTKDPSVVSGVLVDIAAQLKTAGWSLSAGAAADAASKQLSLGLVANGADGVFGSYDIARVQKVIDTVGPVYAAKGTQPKAGLQAADIVTNKFLDKSVRA